MRSNKGTFILVHGAWHGSWCWCRVTPLLEVEGYKVLLPDLPSRYEDDAEPMGLLTRWTDSICELLNSCDEPVVLVGHSRGGALISQVAERHPDGVKVLVYVAGFLLGDGESVLGMFGRRRPSGNGELRVPWESLDNQFYNACAPTDVLLARERLRSDAVAPNFEPIRLSAANFGRVRKVYIECLQDKALPLTLQRQMWARHSCERVISIDADHSPFLSRPVELVERLIEIDLH
jgi:pimeloyl-ACP methyl ester carboxylesterase